MLVLKLIVKYWVQVRNKKYADILGAQVGSTSFHINYNHQVVGYLLYLMVDWIR